MKIFITIWFGQFISRIGTAMTRFALLIWAYEQTGSATTVALLGFFSFVPLVAISPLAGVWVDRLDRRKIMLLADTGAGLTTIVIFLLYLSGGLQIWYLYLAQALAGAFEAFQAPAYTAASSLLLSKKDYARANGLRSMANSGAEVIAPFAAGALLVAVGIGGVMLLDVVTFFVALLTLLLVRIPRLTEDPPRSTAPAFQGFRQEMQAGLSTIWARPGLRGLTFIAAGMSFFGALTWFSILPAMILARTGGDELAVAYVHGALGAAGVAGALLISLWGGPKRKIHGVLLGAALSFACGDLLFALGQNLFTWVVAACLGSFFIPFVTSSSEAIWQSKTQPAVQGRVFAVKQMLINAAMMLGYLLGGILADTWFEPAMMPGGALVTWWGRLIAPGPGGGMAVMFLLTAVAGSVISLAGYLIPTLRTIEEDLPDYDYELRPVAVGPI